jgi:hypothetical protein
VLESSDGAALPAPDVLGGRVLAGDSVRGAGTTFRITLEAADARRTSEKVPLRLVQ